ncbi:aldehyde dehydrogenase family protein [Neobacillus massiliamazoniensis]|uniref:Aldehyde dehydrogenase (NAD) family protein n=1 Tax=Neobacillus massiliamazoniensis TaxID=1499688 RepID=A0A0U1NQ93_9BACI|nr:aldehyde dehydrogenase family protein [Neobacillus massiliamazoniensis]CRK80216.1 aldehyde dehydrogenase (NAD) family protein [Neobacillus massiliamazoniensis]
MTKEVPVYHLFIDGEWVETEEYTEVHDKYTGESIAKIAKAKKEHVTLAVTAAQKAFKENKLTAYERYEILLKTAELMEQRREMLEHSLVQEVGKTVKDARGELDRAISTFRISAEEGKRIAGEMVPLQGVPGSENRLGFTIRVPKGVIGAITPFNYPLLLGAHKIAPALAAGNTVVLKPATVTPIASFHLLNLLHEAGLPKGYLQIITGSGNKVGDWLLSDERIAMYTFTGSSEVGAAIKAKSGMRPVALELGNNSPNIVHEDADLLLAAEQTAHRSFHNAGQACIAVQLIYVHEKVAYDFMDLYLNIVKQLKVGDPKDVETDVGPMIDEREARRSEEWVQEAVAAGATLLLGGKRDGALFYPTVLTNVTHEMKVVCREVFAPIVTIIQYSNIDEAIHLANKSDYGLQAGIFTKDMNLALKASRELEYGGVIVNDVSTYRNDVMPYGGVKKSGLGKEGPRYAIEEMTEVRMVVLNLG